MVKMNLLGETFSRYACEAVAVSPLFMAYGKLMYLRLAVRDSKLKISNGSWFRVTKVKEAMYADN